MTELQRYLAEEVAEDHADGIITRREAMRRLGLLGLGAAAASALLARTPAKADAARSAPRSTRAALATGDDHDDEEELLLWAPVPTQKITFPGPNGTLFGAFAAAAEPRGGILVIHENRGLVDHIRTVAGRLAASGFSALAIDLLSEEGGTEAIGDEAKVAAILASVNPKRFDADMQAGVTELGRRLGDEKLGVTGFCFGGGMVWRLLISGERRVDAAVPFYGPFPNGGSLRRANAAVLAFYGALDTRVNATREEARQALEAAGLTHQFVEFGGADHAFFNDTGPRFNAPAAAEAYRRALGWFDRFLD